MSIISDSDRKAVEDYIRFGVNQASYAYRNTQGLVTNGGSCHGHFMSPFDESPKKRKYKFLATSVGFDKNSYGIEYQKPCQEYIRWILSEDSPWHNAIKGDYELIYQADEKDHIRGVILGPSVFEHDNVNHSYIYNFLLASRITRGYVAYMQTLGFLMYELGIPMFEAVIMMPYFAKNGIAYIRTGGYWNAAASAIRESCDESGNQGANSSWALLDLQALKKGEYNFKPPVRGPGLGKGSSTSHWSSYGWLKRNTDGKKNLTTLLPQNSTVVKSRFTSLICVDPEQIIKFSKDMMREEVKQEQPNVVKEVVQKVKKLGALR